MNRCCYYRLPAVVQENPGMEVVTCPVCRESYTLKELNRPEPESPKGEVIEVSEP